MKPWLKLVLTFFLAARVDAGTVHGDAIDPAPDPSATSAPANTGGANLPASRAAQAPAPAAVPQGDCPRVGFDLLADYDFNVPETPLTNQPAAQVAKLNATIPGNIRAIDKHKVIVTGFMVPLDMTDGKSTNFLLVRDPPGCCYSMPARINEFVSVKLAGKGIGMDMDGPVNIAGTLHVGVRRDLDGYVTGLYEMDGEKEVEDDKK